LDETTIYVDMTIYLSLYYLVNDLVHLLNPHITYTRGLSFQIGNSRYLFENKKVNKIK